MEVAGYLSSTLIGFSLGLLGAGGSILTVPVLVYLFRLEPGVAVRYSLFVVGATSLASSIPRIKKGEVLLAEGISFALFSMITVCLCRKFILPLIPAVLYRSSQFTLTFGCMSMIAFAVLMLLSSRAMLKDHAADSQTAVSPSMLSLICCATGTGLLTGLLGAGGGFLIVPVLLIFFRLSMQQAIGTSLLIITLNSVAGFLSDVGSIHPDWGLIATVTALALAGSILGRFFSDRIETAQLKKAFSWFIFGLAIIILVVQTGGLLIPDVRKPSPFMNGSVQGSENIPLSRDLASVPDLHAFEDYLVYCAGGYRSMIFISLLKAKGIHSLVNVSAGYNAIAKLQASAGYGISPASLKTN